MGKHPGADDAPGVEEFAEEAAGGDLETIFTELVQGDPDGYRIYVYQLQPPPRFRPGKPAYADVLEASEVLTDLEPEIARRFGPGVFRLELRGRNGARIRRGEIQISDRAARMDGAGDSRRADPGGERIARLEAQLVALTQAIQGGGARGGGDLDTLERVAGILRNVNHPAVDMTALAGFGMQALQTGVRLGRGMEPGERGDGFDWQSLAQAFTALVRAQAPAAAPPVPRPAPLVFDTGRPFSEQHLPPAAPDPGARAFRQPPATVPTVVEPPPPGIRRPPPAPVNGDEEEGEEEEEGYTLEETVAQIDGALCKRGDPEWWSGWVMQFAAAPVVDAITPESVEAMRIRLQGDERFPGWNAEHAAEWLQRCARRLELLRAREGNL